MLDDRFIDPYERQNDAPSVWDMFQFMCRHPQTAAAGYAVGIDRSDYRISLDSIAGPPESALVDEARTFCAKADETTFTDHVECFWD